MVTFFSSVSKLKRFSLERTAGNFFFFPFQKLYLRSDGKATFY